MNGQEKDNTCEGRVVLVVLRRHVKTVKSALERADRLDRGRNITSVIPEEELDDTNNSPGISRHDRSAQTTGESEILRSHVVPPSSTAHPERTGAGTQFPILQFDVVSGEYRSIADSPRPEDCNLSDGCAARSTSGPTSSRTNVESQLPGLQFDLTRGEYVPDSELPGTEMVDHLQDSAVRPHVETASANADTTIRFQALHFNVVSGQYDEDSQLSKPKRSGERGNERWMRVPTTFPYIMRNDTLDDASDSPDYHELKHEILDHLLLSDLAEYITLSYHTVTLHDTTNPTTQNPLRKALHAALDEVDEDALAPLAITKADLLSQSPESYSVYRPLLLFPHNVFSHEPWPKLLATYPFHSKLLEPIWRYLAEAVGATRVAINSPIPSQTPSQDHPAPKSSTTKENILRRPVNITPIYGAFGPTPTPQILESPTSSDFANALWVRTTQNGIHQTWAPLHTMFSRGNIKEKTRILSLPTVATDCDVPAAAADLYAGIGYFAFSYMKAGKGQTRGVETVLGWELNPWSVEGLRRGAEMNGWSCKIYKEVDVPRTEAGWEAWREELAEKRTSNTAEDLWVLQMSNERATLIVRRLGALIPPIRHVNLGLLPSSTLSWPTAVRILDADRDGWIHAHENVGVKDIGSRARSIAAEFQAIVDGDEEGSRERKVHVKHVERVKMYAPGVVHCVFDVHVSGREQVVYEG